jgi:hypothetical protein
MPRIKRTTPRVSREKGQRSVDLPEALVRILPPWHNPKKFFEANIWRQIVASQPTAVICREAIISWYLSLEWKIEPKDSEKRDELKEDIDYYTEFFEDTGKYTYDQIIEWIGKDLLDIPFGGAAELGREGDRPDGRVLWLELLDGGTLFPFPNKDTPVGQLVREAGQVVPIYFPKHAINRVYYSPETYIRLEGWGMPPPQKIYLALELLNRGDVYYANLLTDTPEAGILDLGDMAKKSAEEWVKGYREMLGGIDPLKIPVLYEHTNKVEFIPFGRSPTELMYDRITAKYASILAAGYGLTLSDIGIQTTTSGGDTLAGSIRDERKTRRAGFARFKRKIVSFFNFMLPDGLYYKIIDQDDELSVALSRARLANATAAAQFIDKRIFTPGEMRRQTISDGLITISVPEKVPEDEFPDEVMETENERTNMLGKPVAPSQGGHGEVLPRGDVFSDAVYNMTNVPNAPIKKLVRSIIHPLKIETDDVLEKLDDGELDAWSDWHDEAIWGDLDEELPELTMSTLMNSRSMISKVLNEEKNRWWILDVSEDAVYADFESVFLESLNKEFGHEYVSDELEQKFRVAISEILFGFDEFITNNIENCIIAGTKKSLIDTELNAKSLDEDEIISDNRTVDYVRQELLQLAHKINHNFAVQLSDAINNILGDI